ncbi:MAG: hypothetical protein F6J93_06340 [Oscillatoria sp. SIO1A7]|nr:hypothetical protein [Oscillatoria sp. SIO1A7]
MTDPELPLLELFKKLREAGLPLGLEEYQLALRALQSGFGIPDRAALARLCRTLWVKSPEEKIIFDSCFEKVMAEVALSSGSKSVRKPEDSQEQKAKARRRLDYAMLLAVLVVGSGVVLDRLSTIDTTGNTIIDDNNPVTPGETTPTELPDQPATTGAGGFNAPTPGTNNESEQNNTIAWLLPLALALATGSILIWRLYRQRIKKRATGDRSSSKKSAPNSPALGAELTKEIDDEVQVARAAWHESARDSEIRNYETKDNKTNSNQFAIAAEYFPVTRRQMKQSWRYLRRPVRQGPPVELDLEATIEEIGRQGCFLKPVLVPRRSNQSDLLLLVDRDGSMVPFHSLSNRLIQTACDRGRFGQPRIYYFHNCPGKYLYRDPYHLEAELVSSVVISLRSKRAGVLIFSDAGAARGVLNRRRVEQTAAFLQQLGQQIRYVAWLNPMPSSSWPGTSAAEIARLVPMFECDRPGLHESICVLRGKATTKFP